ncbi:hypothetical protein ACH5RR_006781 [Cinchona calisaya]|uniref:Uncharacterized protein n=1 Tax=Cinchona calisaya TaxID=153742 RepID=A0ABD3AQ22_9GENT
MQTPVAMVNIELVSTVIDVNTTTVHSISIGSPSTTTPASITRQRIRAPIIVEPGLSLDTEELPHDQAMMASAVTEARAGTIGSTKFRLYPNFDINDWVQYDHVARELGKAMILP